MAGAFDNVNAPYEHRFDYFWKRVAEWLIDNTAVTFDQIADFCLLHPFEVKRLADGIKDHPLAPIDPVGLGLLPSWELMRVARRPDRRLPHIPGCHRSIPVPEPMDVRNLPTGDPYVVRLSKVPFLVYGRNAWHSIWITRYYYHGSIDIDLQRLMKSVERLRVQGSTWTIEEIPCFTFQFDRSTVLLCEVNEYAGLPAVLADIEADSTSLALVRVSRRCPENTVLLLHMPRNVQFPELRPGIPLRRWRSRPVGADRPLAWDELRTGKFSTRHRYYRMLPLVERLPRVTRRRSRRMRRRRRTGAAQT